MAVQPNTNTTHLDGTLTVRIASWLDLPRSLFPLGISVIFKGGCLGMPGMKTHNLNSVSRRL